jgi:hypothetical protein
LPFRFDLTFNHPEADKDGGVVKKILLVVVGALTVTVLALYLFRQPLLEFVAQRITQDMFVDADPDDFDPGVPVGEPLPPLLAVADGEPVTSLDRFAGPHGLLFMANRSAVW